MKFCHNITNDLNFEPGSLQPCCNTKALRRLPQFAFSGGHVDMNAYKARMVEAVKELQQGGSMCAGCDKLVDVDIPEGGQWDLDIRFATVSINKHRHICNCRCVYCDLWRNPRDSYAILPPLRSLWSQKALRQDCFFSWGGGEPCIIKDFEETSAWILRHGFFQYVHTNALRFSPVLADILRQGRGGVNISIDSGSAETYRAVKGLDGFARVTDTLRQYAEAAKHMYEVHLKYIVFERNNGLEEIERFFQLCRETGITHVQLSLNFHEVNQGALSEATLAGAAFFLKRAEELGMHCMPFYISDALMARIRALGPGENAAAPEDSRIPA